MLNAGLSSYARSAASNLVTDAMSVSRSLASATMAAVRRLYTKPHGATPTSDSSSNKPAAFNSSDQALTDADGFVADADRFLIMGKETQSIHPQVTDAGQPPEPLHLADVIVVADDTGPGPASGSHDQAESAGSESSEGIAKLGEAAIAVNEAEDSLVGIAEELETGRSRDMLRGVVQDAKG